jgi:hypothetical protein
MRETLYKRVFERHYTGFHKDTNVFNPVAVTRSFDINKDDPFGDIGDILGPSEYHPKYRKFTLDHEKKDEETFLKNYGNPLASVMYERVIVVIERFEGKTALKVFNYSNNRKVGKPYFVKHTGMRYVGFNEKEGSVYYGHMTNYHKKRKCSKRMVKNTFYGEPMNGVKAHLRSALHSYFIPEGRISTKDPENLSQFVNEVIQTFFGHLPIKTLETNLTSDELMYKLYLDHNGIKYSNNWKIFRTSFPAVTKKHLKKTNFKYIEAYMRLNGLKGDKLKRILHTTTTTNLTGLFDVQNVFGEKFVLSLDDDTIKNIIDHNLGHITYSINPDRIKILQERPVERKNAFEILKLVISGDIAQSTFNDHFRFYTRLRDIENVKWKSNNYDSFLQEHIDWSEKIDYLNKGTFHRIYPQKFKEEVERVILGIDEVAHPVLLLNSGHYNAESAHQSNCVKTYIKRESSVIISLRLGDVNGKERATIEYQIRHDGEKIFELKRVQSLGRFNSRLEDMWDSYLNILDERVQKLVNNKIFDLPEGVLEHNKKQIHTKMVVGEPTLGYYLGEEYPRKYASLKWGEEVNVNEYLQLDGDELPFI